MDAMANSPASLHDMGTQEEEEEETLVQLLEIKIEEDTEERSCDSEFVSSLHGVEGIIRYEFKNKKLLKEAFTHPSFDDKCTEFERLEYMGDSVLNTLVTVKQFFLYPDLSPGLLTQLRSANIDSEKLARAAIKHGLHHYLRHNNPLLQERIEEFSRAIEDYPLHSHGLIDVPKVLADLVESTIGAVLIDSKSMDVVWKVFKVLSEPLICPETYKRPPMSVLHELCQKHNLQLKFEDRWEESKSFNVIVNGQQVGSATYGPKKEIARNRAAEIALHNVRKFLSHEEGIQNFGSTNQICKM